MANSNVTLRTERRDRLTSAGYKLLWEVQAVVDDGAITVVSSWCPEYIPTHTNKGYKASIFEEDFVLVERFASDDDDLGPNHPMSTSIYLHGNESTALPSAEPKPVLAWEVING
jgi:hypothetical protein